MTTMSDFNRVWAGFAALAATLVPLTASAQSLAYGDVDSGGEAGGSDAKDSARPDQSRGARHRGGRNGSHVSPYIEARQVVSAELSPGNEVLTYSEIAAGVDAMVAGRNNAVSASLRYERRIGWGKANSGDTISGLLRGYAAIVPQTLQIEAGLLATRTRIEDGGAAVLAALGDRSNSTQLYSAYAGPTLSTHMGEAKVDAHYRLGYTKVDTPEAIITAPGMTENNFIRASQPFISEAARECQRFGGTALRHFGCALQLNRQKRIWTGALRPHFIGQPHHPQVVEFHPSSFQHPQYLNRHFRCLGLKQAICRHPPQT